MRLLEWSETWNSGSQRRRPKLAVRVAGLLRAVTGDMRRKRSGSQHLPDGEHHLDLDVKVQTDTCYGSASYPKLTRD